MIERQATDNEVPTGMAKNWNDPMPMGVTEYQGQSAGAGPGKASMAAQQDIPEWKKHIIGGSKGYAGAAVRMPHVDEIETDRAAGAPIRRDAFNIPGNRLPLCVGNEVETIAHVLASLPGTAWGLATCAPWQPFPWLVPRD